MIPPITRSVWSFWTKPFRVHRQLIWFSETHHLLAWILSWETARQHYPDTQLVTDEAGARMLIDGLGLEFTSVSTELDALEADDPDWWALGKLWAYRSQTQPFIHLDSDVFLWKPLPQPVISAPVFAQNPEPFIFGDRDAWYHPEIFDANVKRMNGWLPPEWNWYVDHRLTQAFCCGILGGNQVAFINHYADMALQIATHPRNQAVFSQMNDISANFVLIEQYFLAACVEYHQQLANSPFDGVEIQCLFRSLEDALTPARASEAGYTHLLGEAKRNGEIAQRLENRVAHDYPTQYNRCLRYLGKKDFYLVASRSHPALRLTTDAPDRHVVDGIAEIPADGCSFCMMTIEQVSSGSLPHRLEQADEVFIRTTGGLVMDATGQTPIRALHLQAGRAMFRLISESTPKVVTVSVLGRSPLSTAAEIQIEFVHPSYSHTVSSSVKA